MGLWAGRCSSDAARRKQERCELVVTAAGINDCFVGASARLSHRAGGNPGKAENHRDVVALLRYRDFFSATAAHSRARRSFLNPDVSYGFAMSSNTFRPRAAEVLSRAARRLSPAASLRRLTRLEHYKLFFTQVPGRALDFFMEGISSELGSVFASPACRRIRALGRLPLRQRCVPRLEGAPLPGSSLDFWLAAHSAYDHDRADAGSILQPDSGLQLRAGSRVAVPSRRKSASTSPKTRGRPSCAPRGRRDHGHGVDAAGRHESTEIAKSPNARPSRSALARRSRTFQLAPGVVSARHLQHERGRQRRRAAMTPLSLRRRH